MDETKLKPCRKDDGTFAKKHGMYGTRLYHIWNGLNGRCNNPNNKDYANYGGRGISVCDEWREAQNFFDWAIDNGYSHELSLDRINTNGDYCPNNCRWITVNEQQRNKRNNRIIEYNGKKHCIAEWAELTGIPKQTIVSRLRYGWDVKDVLTIKPSYRNSIKRTCYQSVEQEGE